MIVIPSGAVNGDTACSDISLIIVDDELLESTETFNITLFSASPCGGIDSGATVVEIIEDDSTYTCARVYCMHVRTCT